MSVSTTSTDAVQTVIDILDGTSQSGWPNNTKPSPIESYWESGETEKRRRTQPACYVFSPDVASHDAFGRSASTKIQSEVVEVEVWSRDSDDSSTIAGDVFSILEDYYEDGKQNTAWNRIEPNVGDDQRSVESTETVMGHRDNQYIVSVTVGLEREASMGT